LRACCDLLLDTRPPFQEARARNNENAPLTTGNAARAGHESFVDRFLPVPGTHGRNFREIASPQLVGVQGGTAPILLLPEDLGDQNRGDTPRLGERATPVCMQTVAKIFRPRAADELDEPALFVVEVRDVHGGRSMLSVQIAHLRFCAPGSFFVPG